MLAEVKACGGEGALQNLVDHVGAEWHVQQREGLKVVPSRWGDPVVFRLGRVHSHEGCGVGGSQSPDGSSVGKKGVVDGARD